MQSFVDFCFNWSSIAVDIPSDLDRISKIDTSTFNVIYNIRMF